MTIEALLLLVLFAFVLLGSFMKPMPTFAQYGPMLGARLENHLYVGRSFIVQNPSGGAASLNWNPAPGPAPNGSFQ
jgi:hypothetical protein